MSLSKIVVSGRVVRVPEKRFTPTSNIAVTEFAIGVESHSRDGTTETNVVKVVTWRDLAERCAQELKKGDLVAVDGRLQMSSYTTSDGQRRREAEVEAIAVENLSRALAGAPDKEPLDRPVAKVGSRAEAPPSEELDAIFASEDEIPF